VGFDRGQEFAEHTVRTSRPKYRSTLPTVRFMTSPAKRRAQLPHRRLHLLKSDDVSLLAGSMRTYSGRLLYLILDNRLLAAATELVTVHETSLVNASISASVMILNFLGALFHSGAGALFHSGASDSVCFSMS
jgi:hypothetical protein